MNTLAMDKSARYKDQDGNLHVTISNISKATVNPYRGSEIPGWEALGLDGERIYQLFRDPVELEKGAATFNNLRLLSKHVAVSASDPKEELVAGSTGTDAAFDGTYLTNSLVIWRAEDIAAIESGGKCELSCAYYYRPVMEPGDHKGLRYDGKMCDIVGNHVALVEAGRAGPDVAVHDSLENLMPLPLKSRQALVIKGALSSYLKPKLLAGTTLALDAALADVTSKNWPAIKAKVTAKVIALAKPKLAADASLEDMHGFMDRLDREEDEEAMDEEDDDEDVEAMDEEEAAAENEERKKEREAKMEAKDCKAARDARRSARDAKRAADAKARDKARDSETEEERMKRETEDKAKDAKAMDAALKAVETRTVARMNAISEAREVVRPLIGNVSLALDSADAVYKLALDAAKVDLTGVEPSAYRAMVKMLKDRTEKPRALALDSKPGGAALETRFPGLAAIGVG